MGIYLKDRGFSLLAPQKCASTSLERIAFEIGNTRVFGSCVRKGQRVGIRALNPSRSFSEQCGQSAGPLFGVVRERNDGIHSCRTNQVLKHKALDKVAFTEADHVATLPVRSSIGNSVENSARDRAVSRAKRHQSDPLVLSADQAPGSYQAFFDLSMLVGFYARLRGTIGNGFSALRHLRETRNEAKLNALSAGLRARIEAFYREDCSIFGKLFTGTEAATRGAHA
jgi:hypothetical protein